MSEQSNRRAEDFLRVSDQFRLGELTTEASHPVTAELSSVANADPTAALRLLFEVDGDVLRAYRKFAQSDLPHRMANALLASLRQGGNVFFTGCGSTGRLSILLVSIWRDFWQRRRSLNPAEADRARNLENRAFSVMAGGDFALIKSVEGFEDFAAFGRRQIADLGVSARDIVFAITEGGETSFVIGTAWQGLAAGAAVFFVYNNPDEVLSRHVDRSREVIEDPRIEKINLTTGPMAITGSTRMQATTIQLCVLLTVLEMVVREWLLDAGWETDSSLGSTAVPDQFALALGQMLDTLRTPELLSRLADLVALETSVYLASRKNNYYADRFAIDVLTDTTERSPTFCTPPFRKFDDKTAAESWSYLFAPSQDTAQAWASLLKRQPQCVEWSEQDVRALVDPEKVQRTCEVVQRISRAELMRFKIGLDGANYRVLGPEDGAVGVLGEDETKSLLLPDGFHRRCLEGAHHAGARMGLIYLGRPDSLGEIQSFATRWLPGCVTVLVPVSLNNFLIADVGRVGLKMLLNALSTCTMVRLGRVLGNYMIWVVPSNLKLIDRSTRYIQKLTGLEYAQANRLLYEVIEHVEPRMRADQAYPPVVGVAVMRARYGLGNQEAEERLLVELGPAQT